MGRNGFGNTPDTIRLSSAPVTAPPFTMAGWIYPISGTYSFDYTVFALNNSTGAAGRDLFYCALNGTSGNLGAAEARTADSSSSSSAVGTVSATLNAWNHVCAVFASSTDRRSYLNGGDKATDTTSKVPSGINRCSIGLSDNSSPGFGPGGGAVAECAIWNIVLTDADAASLATGLSPLLMHPESLVFYAPLWGQSSPEHNLIGTSMTIVGGVTDAGLHPPIMRPRRTLIGLR